MAKKRTKPDQARRNAERLEKLEETHRGPEINEQPAGPADAINMEEQIRRRAYELYEARGRQSGQELKDWLKAEAEIRRRATGISNIIPFRSGNS